MGRLAILPPRRGDFNAADVRWARCSPRVRLPALSTPACGHDHGLKAVRNGLAQYLRGAGSCVYADPSRADRRAAPGALEVCSISGEAHAHGCEATKRTEAVVGEPAVAVRGARPQNSTTVVMIGRARDKCNGPSGFFDAYAAPEIASRVVRRCHLPKVLNVTSLRWNSSLHLAHHRVDFAVRGPPECFPRIGWNTIHTRRPKPIASMPPATHHNNGPPAAIDRRTCPWGIFVRQQPESAARPIARAWNRRGRYWKTPT